MSLYHFSDDGQIDTFIPRPVTVPVKRGPGQDWLNGPLVWAIDDWHQPLYLFPRDCPRILMWAQPHSTTQDIAQYRLTTRMVAFVEDAWLARLAHAQLYRYTLPADGFLSLRDAGMWVCKRPVTPTSISPINGLPDALAKAGVELRGMPDLTVLKPAWDSSLHVSGIRLRNAVGWV